MSPTHSRYISRRRRRSSSLPDLRRSIAYKNLANLEHKYVALIGDRGTGRNTLVRRFLHLTGGPFVQRDTRRFNTRHILVDISQRPYIHRPAIVNLGIFIMTYEQLDFQNIHVTISHLESCAVVFDVASTSTFETAINCMVKITHMLGSGAPKFILVGNKIDLRLQRQVLPASGEDVADACGAECYYGCSALMNLNVGPVLDALLVMAIYQHIPLPPP